MNPFLVGALIFTWGVALFHLMLFYLTSDKTKAGFALTVTVISTIVGIFLFIACAASWHMIYGH